MVERGTSGEVFMAKSAGGKKKVAILGAGKMGSILLQSFLRDGLLKASETWVTVAHAERARLLKDKLKVHAGTDNREAVRGADIVFLCVKPQVVADVGREIREDVTENQLLISVAASVPTEMVVRGPEKRAGVGAQTTMGAARVVLETGDHPALLKDAVTTPAGCTIDGIMELEEGKLRVTLIKAVVKAVQRAKELAFS